MLGFSARGAFFNEPHIFFFRAGIFLKGGRPFFYAGAPLFHSAPLFSHAAPVVSFTAPIFCSLPLANRPAPHRASAGRPTVSRSPTRPAERANLPIYPPPQFYKKGAPASKTCGQTQKTKMSNNMKHVTSMVIS